MKTIRKMLAVLMVLVLAISLVACSNSKNEAENESNEASKYVGNSKVAYNPDIQEDGVNRLGVAWSSLGFAANQMLVKHYETMYKDYGFDEVVSVCADNDLEKQINQIQDLVNQKCDVIIVNSVDSDGIAGVCDQAQAAGVAVMAVNRTIGTDVYYTLVADNVEAGHDVATAISLATYKEGIEDGSVHVLTIVGDLAASAQHDRFEGQKATWSNYPWMKVVATPTARETSAVYDAVMDAFTADPTIKAVTVSAGDDNITPIVSALRELGKPMDPTDPDYVYIGTVDGCPNALEAIEAGESYCCAVQRFDLFCTQALQVAGDYIKGQYVSGRDSFVELPLPMMTRATIDSLAEQDLLWARGWFTEVE